MRTEFGFERTPDCSCDSCVGNCKTQPGYLIPADLPRIVQEVRKQSCLPSLSPSGIVRMYLEPGKGALVGRRGEMYRLDTIRPARRPDTGHCIFLKNDKCMIHEVSPYGCAFFKCNDNGPEEQARRIQGLTVIANDARDNGPYSLAYQMLYAEKGLPKDAHLLPVQRSGWSSSQPSIQNLPKPKDP